MRNLKLDTGYPSFDVVIETSVTLHQGEIRELLTQRDIALLGWRGTSALSDPSMEVLSELRMEVDAKLCRAAG